MSLCALPAEISSAAAEAKTCVADTIQLRPGLSECTWTVSTWPVGETLAPPYGHSVFSLLCM